jgi:hypothetical protein
MRYEKEAVVARDDDCPRRHVPARPKWEEEEEGEGAACGWRKNEECIADTHSIPSIDSTPTNSSEECILPVI